MIFRILNIARPLTLTLRSDEDAVDRLNFCTTPMLLIALSSVLFMKTYVTRPIRCWVPKNFPNGWRQYTENYCFAKNTYYLPFDEYIPNNYDEREQREISYYQWAPFYLMVQAFCFFLPIMIWRALNHLSGIRVKSITAMAAEGAVVRRSGDCAAQQSKAVNYVAANIADCLRMQNNFKSTEVQKSWCGGYVTIVYMVSKVIFLFNVVSHVFLLNVYLGFSYKLFWGYNVLRDLLKGLTWEDTSFFPRVTMCDFDVRELENVHRHTVQCVLPINMYTEKVFLFTWWWFILVIICTVLNLVHWIINILYWPNHRRFLTRHLFLAAEFCPNMSELTRFTEFIRMDGILLLQLIQANAGTMFTADVIHNLWKLYKLGNHIETRSVKLTDKLGDAITSSATDNVYGTILKPKREKTLTAV